MCTTSNCVLYIVSSISIARSDCSFKIIDITIKLQPPLAMLSYWYVDKTKKIIKTKHSLYKFSFESTMITVACLAISCSVLVMM